MQYVRSISGSVSKTWNSINPATLSGAIDVIVVEGEDGTLACSPFHVRFGKFSLLRPYEKKVEFSVNNEKQNYAMKLGEGGEAFFVFETSDDIPEALQTSPLVSPASSPPLPASGSNVGLGLQEPDFLDISTENGQPRSRRPSRPGPRAILSSSAPRDPSNLGALTPLSTSPDFDGLRPKSGDWSESHSVRPHSDDILPRSQLYQSDEHNSLERERHARSLTPNLLPIGGPSESMMHRSHSPPPLPTKEAIERAIALSRQLSTANIPSQVTETGDLMLDMTGYKSSDDDALRAEVIARKILSEELEGNYDIGALIGADEHGNLWIYSSEEAKEAATQRSILAGIQTSVPSSPTLHGDASSDPGYHSDVDSDVTTLVPLSPGPSSGHRRSESEQSGLGTPPKTPPDAGAAGDPNRNYAKTLRLTSDQLMALGLKPGANPMSFTVNRATCTANMYLWKYDVPIVISDIDGTITKSDALGHVLNMIGRDWTHIGVAKLYTEIVANGYNIMYLTSRSVGQADLTRAYLAGVVQDGYKLPRGPTILSPDRTIAALRRELYIRKPEVFKMACLRDIKNLFGPGRSPFYAGFGNRLTDALSYRSVSIPSNRIFTINSYAEVSLDLLSLNKLKLSYVNMREVVDHYFPPVNTLVKGGGEEFTDFTYWRDTPLELDDFSASDSEENDEDDAQSDEEEEEEGDPMGESFISHDESILSDNVEDEYDEDGLTSSMMEAEEDEEDGDEGEEGEEEDADDDEDEDDLNDPVSAVHLRRSREQDHTETIPDLGTNENSSEAPEGERDEDHDAELITGMKTIALKHSDSNHDEPGPVPA